MFSGGDNRVWMQLAALDVSADRALGVHDLLSARIRASYRTIATGLTGEYPELASRIHEVLDIAPQVVSYGAGYQWITALHRVIREDDLEAFDQLGLDFVRFSAAAAVLSGGDFIGKLALATNSADGRHTDGPVAIPLVGAFDIGSSSTLSVISGRVDGRLVSSPRMGGIRVEAYESTYRLPRSQSQFCLNELGQWQKAHDEIAAATALAEQVVPGLFDRYLTDVVPLVRQGRISNAGTDEAAPFVVYSSFGRSPLDLVACFAHEEAHALINTAEKLLGPVLPETEAKMPVPWKPGMMRSLSNVIHGLISFGRATQVRGRALYLGLSDNENEEARIRESDWVRSVTSQLKDGILGPMPDSLVEWLEGNQAALEPSAVPHTPSTSILAEGGGVDDATCPWTLFTSSATTRAAVEQYSELACGSWQRGSGEFPDQDRRDLDVGHGTHLGGVTGTVIPSLIRERYGVDVELTSVKAHRLRKGDSIRSHTDHGSSSAAYRAVIGASAAPPSGGEFRLCDPQQRPVVGIPMRFGDTVVMAIDQPGEHEVTRVESDTYRHTIIATYRRAGLG